jgi:hypothetical protein
VDLLPSNWLYIEAGVVVGDCLAACWRLENTDVAHVSYGDANTTGQAFWHKDLTGVFPFMYTHCEHKSVAMTSLSTFALILLNM